MRNLKIITPLFIALLTVLSSCSNQQDVVSKHFIQKRKHLPGFHLNLNKGAQHKVTPAEDVAAVETKPTQQMSSKEKVIPIKEDVLGVQNESTEAPVLIASSDDDAPKLIDWKVAAPALALKFSDDQWQFKPKNVLMTNFKKKSAIKRRSGWALFLSIIGSVLFAALAANIFLSFLTSGVLLLTLVQIALLLGGLLLGWKYKDTNGASRTAFILSWIFLGLTGLLYFGLIVLGML